MKTNVARGFLVLVSLIGLGCSQTQMNGTLSALAAQSNSGTAVGTPSPTPISTPLPTPISTPNPTVTPVPTPRPTPLPTVAPKPTPVPTPLPTPLPTPVVTSGSGTCASAPAITMPANACSITTYGAVGDGKTNNAAAIQNAFNAAASSHCTVLIPAGNFAYSGTLTAKGIAVTGTGAASILIPLDVTNEAIILTADGTSMTNLHSISNAKTRLTAPQQSIFWVNNATNFTIQNNLIEGSADTGVFVGNSSGGTIKNNTAIGTLADSMTMTGGTSNVTLSANRIINAGDDGISNDGYSGLAVPTNITMSGNTILNNLWGRGLEVSGGSNINFIGNYIDNTDGYADIFIATEYNTTWKTQGVNTVTVSGNALLDSGPNQGSIIIDNDSGSNFNISNVSVSGNQFVKPGWGAVQYTGNGIESGISVQNNTDYSSIGFSSSDNAQAVVVESGNKILSPASYATPLVQPGGGCNFTGCAGATSTSDCSAH